MSAVYYSKGNAHRLPRRVRGECGAENVKVSYIQRFSRRNHLAEYNGAQSLYKGSKFQIRELRGGGATFENVLIHFGSTF